MKPKKWDVLVAGEINPDLILSDPNLDVRFGQVETLVKNAALTVGSSSVIFACQAARLGLKVGFIGVVGDDLFGRFMTEALAARGIDTTHVIVDPSLGTGFTVILDKISDRSMLTYLGAINALTAARIPDKLLRRARHLHLASFFLQDKLRPDVPDLFKRARALGLSTSLDTNWDPTEEWEGVLPLLSQTSVFLPNENEALSITGKSNVEVAARVLASYAGQVAIKMGGDGALAYQGEQQTHAGVIPVQVVDTVGAGDSFDAGYVYGYLQGWSLERCLSLGIACGSLSTRSAGGTNAQPTLAEALEAV